jgi:uncharacterized protein HemX
MRYERSRAGGGCGKIVSERGNVRPSRRLTVIALFTAVLGLATAGVALLNESRKIEEVAIAQANEREAVQQREAERQALLRETLCRGHLERVERIEADFQQLVEEHGTLMRLLQQCRARPEAEQQQDCGTLVCAGAYLLSDGDTNCMAVVLEADTIRANLGHARAAMARDACSVPASPAEAALNEGA